MEAQPTTEHERECLVEIIAPKEQIRKFFFERHFDFLTSVPQRRLQEMILSSCTKGNSGKMTDFGESGTVHRTTYGHFLAKGKLDDKRLEETQKRESFQTVSELSHQHGTPLFVSIDDTVVPETSCQGLFNTVYRIFKVSTKQKPGASWLPACSCATYSSAIIWRTSSRSIRLILSSIVSVLVSLKCAHTR